MKTSLKTLIIVLLIVMSFSAAQAFECTPKEVCQLIGKICGVDPDSNPTKIWIAPNELVNCDNTSTVEIIGFPFHNLEAQLEKVLLRTVTIDVGDCVKIEYYLKKQTPEVYKWISLLVYCEGCQSCEKCDELDDETCLQCTNNDDCFDDDMERKPQQRKWDEGLPPGLEGDLPPGWDGGELPPGLDEPLPGQLP